MNVIKAVTPSDYFVIKFSDGLYLKDYGKRSYQNYATDQVDESQLFKSLREAKDLIEERSLDAEAIRVLVVQMWFELDNELEIN